MQWETQPAGMRTPLELQKQHTWIVQEMALAYGWGNGTLIYVKTESGSGPAACVCVGNFHRLSAVWKQ